MDASHFSLAGQTVLVTGASGGIGAYLAEVAAGAGAAVVLAARRVDSCRALAERLQAAGAKAHAVALDVTDAAGFDAALQTAEEAAGPISVLVNNAGIAVTAAAHETTAEDWDRVLATNLTGGFRLSQAVAARWIAGGRGGTIVNIASMYGLGGARMLAAYTASKGGLINLTRSLAIDWARHDIRVNALAPGYIITDINRDTLVGDVAKSLQARVPLRRFGQLPELAGPFLLLASPAGSYMTGAVLSVDGGQSAWM